MKTFYSILFISCLSITVAKASVYPTSSTRESRRSITDLSRFSIGIDGESVNHEVDFRTGNESTTIEASTAGFYLGYEVFNWYTLFVSAGVLADGKSSSRFDTGEGAKFTVGLSALLLDYDIVNPGYLAGKLSFRPAIQFSRYEWEQDDNDLYWIDVTADATIGYEIFDRYPKSVNGIDTSLAFYAGPAISALNGSMDINGVTTDFETSIELGVVAGMELYLSPTVGFGVRARGFPYGNSVNGSFRFHF